MGSSKDGGDPNLKALQSIVLKDKPSCLQFCPASPDLFVVGLYNLDHDQKRSGHLLLFQLKVNEMELFTLRREHAVLNLEFHPVIPRRFVAAMSGGRISFYGLEDDLARGSAYIEGRGAIQAFSSSVIVLALSWHKCCKYVLGVSLSTGHVATIQFNEDFTEGRVIHRIPHPHTNEAWSLAWTPSPYSVHQYPTQGLYSGGDDSRLRGVVFTLKPNQNINSATQAALIGGERGLPGHDAGITAILPLPLGFQAGEDIILTGSYDEYIRVYALREHRPDQSNHRPKVLAEMKLGDGVWRLSFLRDYSLIPITAATEDYLDDEMAAPPDNNNQLPNDTTPSLPTDTSNPSTTRTLRVLASCMRAGAQILQIQGSPHGEWSITRLAAFTEHESMCYAAAAQPVGEEESLANRLDDRGAVCVSASFYDRLLCLWRFREGEEEEEEEGGEERQEKGVRVEGEEEKWDRDHQVEGV